MCNDQGIISKFIQESGVDISDKIISFYRYNIKECKPFVDLDKELKDGIESCPLYRPKPLKGIVSLSRFNETYTIRANNNKEE